MFFAHLAHQTLEEKSDKKSPGALHNYYQSGSASNLRTRNALIGATAPNIQASPIDSTSKLLMNPSFEVDASKLLDGPGAASKL
jgi:hypothetical protein